MTPAFSDPGDEIPVGGRPLDDRSEESPFAPPRGAGDRGATPGAVSPAILRPSATDGHLLPVVDDPLVDPLLDPPSVEPPPRDVRPRSPAEDRPPARPFPADGVSAGEPGDPGRVDPTPPVLASPTSAFSGGPESRRPGAGEARTGTPADVPSAVSSRATIPSPEPAARAPGAAWWAGVAVPGARVAPSPSGQGAAPAAGPPAAGAPVASATSPLASPSASPSAFPSPSPVAAAAAAVSQALDATPSTARVVPPSPSVGDLRFAPPDQRAHAPTVERRAPDAPADASRAVTSAAVTAAAAVERPAPELSLQAEVEALVQRYLAEHDAAVRGPTDGGVPTSPAVPTTPGVPPAGAPAGPAVPAPAVPTAPAPGVSPGASAVPTAPSGAVLGPLSGPAARAHVRSLISGNLRTRLAAMDPATRTRVLGTLALTALATAGVIGHVVRDQGPEPGAPQVQSGPSLASAPTDAFEAVRQLARAPGRDARHGAAARVGGEYARGARDAERSMHQQLFESVTDPEARLALVAAQAERALATHDGATLSEIVGRRLTLIPGEETDVRAADIRIAAYRELGAQMRRSGVMAAAARWDLRADQLLERRRELGRTVRGDGWTPELVQQIERGLAGASHPLEVAGRSSAYRDGYAGTLDAARTYYQVLTVGRPTPASRVPLAR